MYHRFTEGIFIITHMRIHIFRQPIFFIARRLIHPVLSHIGINTHNQQHMNIYNRLWDVNANISRTSGLFHSFYLSWQFRRFLQGRITPSYINQLINNYNLNNNSSLTNLLFRVTSTGYNLPFIRTINYILASIACNIFKFFIKRFIFTSIFGLFSTIFTGITSTLAIFWIPTLRDITNFLNFAFKMKDLIDSYLPFGLEIPVPDFLKYRKTWLAMLGLGFLKLILPIWLTDFLNLINFWSLFSFLSNWIPNLGILSYFSFLAYPIKNFCYFIGYKLIEYLNIPDHLWKNFDYLINRYKNRNFINPLLVEESTETNIIYNLLIKILDYLFDELNLFE